MERTTSDFPLPTSHFPLRPASLCLLLRDDEVLLALKKRGFGQGKWTGVGGKPEPATLTARDKEICDAIGPVLRERGLIFVGIDVIGEWLTEINVTSPTGIREVKRFGGPDIAARIWEVIEAKRKRG